jgi:hypothetical protein
LQSCIKSHGGRQRLNTFFILTNTTIQKGWSGGVQLASLPAPCSQTHLARFVEKNGVKAVARASDHGPGQGFKHRVVAAEARSFAECSHSFTVQKRRSHDLNHPSWSLFREDVQELSNKIEISTQTE